MNIDQELLELCSIEADETQPILSLTLDTRWANEQQRERVRLFVHDQGRAARLLHPPESQLGQDISRTVQDVEARVGSLISNATNLAGFALFASSSRGLWKEIHSVQLPLTASFAVAPEPHIVPLLSLADVAPTLLAVVDRRGGTVYESRLGDIVYGTELTLPEAPRQKPNERWHRHDQRHFMNQRGQNRAELATLITQRWDLDPQKAVVLAGSPDLVAAIRGLLPSRVQANLLPDLHPAAPVSDAKAQALATQQALRHARNQEGELVERLIGQAMTGARAVLGPDDVTLAVEERRVYRLYLEQGLKLLGWRCTTCEAIGTQMHAGCPYCGGPMETKDLSEELSRRVVRDGGEAIVVHGNGKLHHFAGIAAQLRHRTSRGNIGYVFQ